MLAAAPPHAIAYGFTISSYVRGFADYVGAGAWAGTIFARSAGAPWEEDLGRPVLTANQVAFWHVLRLSGRAWQFAIMATIATEIAHQAHGVACFTKEDSLQPQHAGGYGRGATNSVAIPNGRCDARGGGALCPTLEDC